MWRRGLFLLLLVAIFGFVASTPLLGAHKCTWGPSYWCSNITNAKGCKAVSHCIKAVWEKQIVPQDDDEVCKICTDMVTQARDQLESNQTQEDLKAVFEGSCKLIPLDVVSNQCIKLVDEFIPELVETLASQMNPQVVCTVAGLCNNAEIDKMLADMKPKENDVSVDVEQCNSCFSVIDKMRSNFDGISYENFLENMLKGCRRLSSFSDACATLVFSNYETIYNGMKTDFYPDNVCHITGTCSYKFHQHNPEPKTAAVEITPMGNVGILEVEKSDLTCDFCKKLVIHMRDIIVANTTEEEFKQVMEGICKQTGTFKSECLSIVDQYYPMIYGFLVKELDPDEVCFMAGICQKGMKTDGPIAPLVPVATAELAIKIMRKESEPKIIGRDEYNSYKTNSQEVKPTEKSQANVQILKPELSQLPIDRMVIQLPQSKEVCAFCQYFLHYVQTEISDDKTEEKIKTVVEKACKNLPNSIEAQCESFIEAYGDAVIALLVQEIDPSTVCPAISLCPKDPQLSKMDVLMTTGSNNKPNCPLCLFAVEQLEIMLKDNTTEDNIKHAMENLCSHLPTKLRSECTDFVETYSKQLIEMISAEFTPQEVCVFLKLCIDNKPSPVDAFHEDKMLMADRNRFKTPFLPKNMLANANHENEGLIATNEIPDYTYNGKMMVKSDPKNLKTSPQCVVCEFIMSQLEKELKDQSTEDEIKKAVHSVCHHLPKTVQNECDTFVDKYGDLVITLLTTLSPAEVCASMNMCPDNKFALREAVTECSVCNELVSILNQILNNPEVDRKIERLTEKACYALPGKYLQRCFKLMKTYGESIIHLVTHWTDLSRVCGEIGVCGTGDHTYLDLTSNEQTVTRKSRETKLLGTKKCSWGPKYWCENEEQASECKALNHCQVNVWKADKPNK